MAVYASRLFRLDHILVLAAAAWPLQPLMAAAPAEQASGVGALQEITVTARKAPEQLQSVPVSISVLSSNEIANAAVTEFADVISHFPNVAMSGGIAGVLQGQLGIRGISTLTRNIGTESGVGIYVDGVYMGRSDNYNQELIDIGQIEVLRGPQGTLFGKNTIAGVFNITTLEPQGVPSATIKGDTGDFDLARVHAYAMGPLVDGVLSGKIVGGYLYRDGIYTHITPGGQNGDRQDLASYRAALYYTPTPGSKFVFSFDGLTDRGNPAFFQVTDQAHLPTAMQTRPLTVDNNRPDFLHRDNYGLSLTATVDTGGSTFTSISAYRRSHYRASLDDDQTQFDIASADVWGEITKFFTQELRLNGHMSEHLKYVAGVYYIDQKVTTDKVFALGKDFSIVLGFPPGLGPSTEPPLLTTGEVDRKNYAAFTSLDYLIGPRTTASLGLRYSKEDSSANLVQADPTGLYTGIGLPNVSYAKSETDHDLSPTASVSYQFMPGVVAYTRFAKGFKSAAYTVDLVSSSSGLSAGPEHATTDEIGFKSDWLGHRLRANLAAFDTHYDDMQVSQLLGSGVTLNNAGKASIRGYEVELAGYLTRNFKLEGSMGYLDARYDRYPGCTIPTSLGGGATDCSGNRIVAAPKYTFQTATEYEWPLATGSLIARVDYNVQSPVFFTAYNTSRFASDWRHVLDTRVGVSGLGSGGHWDFFVWGKNLTNDTYVVYRDDRSAVGVLQTTAYGDPRTYGVSVGAHF